MIHVAFLSDAPKAAAVKGFGIEEFAPDEMAIVGREAHLLYPDGYARTKLTNAVLEKQLGVPGDEPQLADGHGPRRPHRERLGRPR